MACITEHEGREVENFNFDWQFTLSDTIIGEETVWNEVQLPHDWSIEAGYKAPLPINTTDGDDSKSENDNNLPTGVVGKNSNVNRLTASSTGFVLSGIGWYRKSFVVSKSDLEKKVFIEFDGVYTNSSVWINNQLLGQRPNGFVSFSYDLTPYLNAGTNTLTVKVDHSNYVDSRWYTGSGIYRNVRLVKKNNIYLPQYPVFITTPTVSKALATVKLQALLVSEVTQNTEVEFIVNILSPEGKVVAKKSERMNIADSLSVDWDFEIEKPQLWGLIHPHLYIAEVTVKSEGRVLDRYSERFGIRTAVFTADKGFLLNGKSLKIKGVNLHQDMGALGAAVPKMACERRLKSLKAMGCNAVRTAHHAFDPQFLDLCDELGLLVMAEFFDEWTSAKGKHTTELGANDAPKDFTRGYSSFFNQWAQRDLKDGIRRDRNHPSIIMWSIGNEIEWTFAYYSAAYRKVNGNVEYYKYNPQYDSLINKTAFDQVRPNTDSLVLIARLLNKWVKQEDATRPTTIGSVFPVITCVSGLSQVVDVLGFNYRACEYDGAHQEYPELKMIGSENFGTWQEWKAVKERDFVAGIFTWTGCAYMGEAGPYPRKGLNLSFFDFAGFKTPRGHFIECLWNDKPKVYMGTTPLKDSEYKYDARNGFSLELNDNWLRRWTWYDIYNSWNYADRELVVVQAYTNCEEAELFLNSKSLGKQRLEANDDRVIKWLVPYKAGQLKLVGYSNKKAQATYSLNTAASLAAIKIKCDTKVITSNGEDLVFVEVKLCDAKGVLIPNNDVPIEFKIEGDGQLIAIDNGSEYNVEPAKGHSITTFQGKALGILRASKEVGYIKVAVQSMTISSNELLIQVVKH